MGLFNFLKKSSAANPEQQTAMLHRPYRDESVNLIYNLLFCDDLPLFKKHNTSPEVYPWNILFSGNGQTNDLQKITQDPLTDPRTKILAYNQLLAKGIQPQNKELLAVIVEVGLEQGPDVLASFKDGTARYINQTGRLLVWEITEDEQANAITRDLFEKGLQIVKQIGPWDKPRRPQPPQHHTRISFLVSDGLYFGEAGTDTLFNDPMAAPALTSATQLMQYLTTKSLEKERST